MLDAVNTISSAIVDTLDFATAMTNSYIVAISAKRTNEEIFTLLEDSAAEMEKTNSKYAKWFNKIDSCICLYVNPPDKLRCYLSPTHSPEWTRALSYAAQISMLSNIATK